VYLNLFENLSLLLRFFPSGLTGKFTPQSDPFESRGLTPTFRRKVQSIVDWLKAQQGRRDVAKAPGSRAANAAIRPLPLATVLTFDIRDIRDIRDIFVFDIRDIRDIRDIPLATVLSHYLEDVLRSISAVEREGLLLYHC